MNSAGEHAEELSRRISQIELGGTRRRSDTSDSLLGPRHEIEDVVRLRPIDALALSHGNDFYQEGYKTPPQTRAPASTPAAPASPAIEHTCSTHATDSGIEAANTESEGTNILTGIGAAKPAKKKRKSSGKSRSSHASGFEEYYAEAPLTPADHEEEEEIYSTFRPFTERIEHCIQRYRQKRKLDSFRANVFTKWLSFGGIDASSTKSFTGGLDADTVENSTAEEIAAIRATDYIRGGINNRKFYDPEKPEGWVVDFTGVMKGFLSHLIFEHFNIQSAEDVRAVTAVLKNFLNYLLLHNVCTEYRDDVLQARSICNLAEHQIPLIMMARKALPGDFNIAASSIYGGRYKDTYIDINEVASDGWDDDVYPGFSIPKAEHIFNAITAVDGPGETFDKFTTGEVSLIKTERMCFEIVEIHRAKPPFEEPHTQPQVMSNGFESLKPVGTIVVKQWEGPGFEYEDLTDDEDNDLSKGQGEMTKDLSKNVSTFWLEDEILQYCFEGMKLELTVHNLNTGIQYFDAILGIYCSFFELLSNAKMRGWKEPVPNDRPAPTEADPLAEESAMNTAAERDQSD